ncbi:MAG: glycoside hydrolase family 108 protein [Burkholderiales bacterium]|nr:glycoside hydrolase family 108 protein [Burkholderiales bacterium]
MPVSARFAACLAQVLRHEGGYVDHPADPGGATNLGITLATLAAWRGKPVTKQDVRDLTVAEAGEIYRTRYWLPIRGDALPPGVDLAVFDAAVNSGPMRAAKWLQSVLGVAQDGEIGLQTLAALARAPGPVTVITDLCDARMRYLRGLPTWSTFGRGWTRRVAEVEGEALRVAR